MFWLRAVPWGWSVAGAAACWEQLGGVALSPDLKSVKLRLHC